MSSNLISFNYLSTGKNTPGAFVAKNPHAPDAKRSIEIVNLIAAQFTQQFLRTRIRSEQTVRHPCCCHEHADVETHRWSRPGLGRCRRCNCQNSSSQHAPELELCHGSLHIKQPHLHAVYI